MDGLIVDDDTEDSYPKTFRVGEENKFAETSSMIFVRKLPSDDLSDFGDEDDEDDFSADFRLKDKLYDDQAYYSNEDGKNKFVEVIKILNRSVVDVAFLGKGEKYFIFNSAGRKSKLVENKGGKKCFYYTGDNLQAQVQIPNGVFCSGMSSSSGLTLSSRRDRHIIENKQLIKIEDGACEYHLRQVKPSPSPQVKVSDSEKSHAWRHVLHSTVFHIFLLLFLGLIPWSTTPDLVEPEVQFVQIDPNFLATLDKQKEPPKKIDLKPRKIEPVKLLKTPPPKKKNDAPKPVKTIAVKKSAAKPVRVAKTGSGTQKTADVSPNRHLKKGGGAGKGNVVNRDIKQVGLLSMIGDSVGIQPPEATAALTNLDAVASPGAGDVNFKVGGIAGKLGEGKISVPGAGYVATKGSSQVLRSLGAAGSGRVAALERGHSGERQVKGLVSAKLTHKVNIQGGMSREAVKRVIDRHLDEISYCYESALINNPSIMGRMTYEWKIKASGSVGEVNIKSATINSNDIHACIKAAIKAWKFPQPQGAEVVVSYPFIFDIVGF